MMPAWKRYFAWLLRPDVRKATRSEQGLNEAFEGWWLAKGRMEYPACGELANSDVEWLRQPAGRLAVEGLNTTLPVPRAMQLVLQ